MKNVLPLLCPVHLDRAVLVSDATIYGREFGKVWTCPRSGCDYRVGAHKGTDAPKGTLANGETRQWRMRAHKAFDGWWQRNRLRRKDAYEFMRRETGIAHIGESSVEECRRVVDAFSKRVGFLQETK